MSLIWPDADGDVVLDQPRLHALVIGVADYPHLNGGSGTPAVDPLGLQQVTTPRFTASAIADWLLNDYKSAGRPLGSLEVLISPDQSIVRPDGTARPAARARFAAIEAAFAEWRARCSSNPDNTAFFYFCGHGLNKNNQFLLPEDFGDPKWPDPWKNNIDFDNLRIGMRSCPAQTQLFFVDACRETPFGTLASVNVQGAPLNAAGFFDTVQCSAAYYATTEGKQAFGPDNRITYFGEAVLKCLNGAGCGNVNGEWTVDTYTLSKALGEVMQHLGRRYAQPLSCNPDVSGMGPINEPSAPIVIASLKCRNDPNADGAAHIRMNRLGVLQESAPGDPKPLVVEVAPGDWHIEVAFPGNQFPGPVSKIYTLLPPVFEGLPVP